MYMQFLDEIRKKKKNIAKVLIPPVQEIDRKLKKPLRGKSLKYKVIRKAIPETAETSANV